MNARPTASLRAAYIAGSYLAVGVAYITTSSWIAAALAPSVEALERLETLKGVGFIVTTALVVFAATRAMLARTESDADTLRTQREVLVASERQALAGTMAAAIAHDVNNVLVALLGELDTMPPNDSLAGARRAADRIIELNRRLSGVARGTTATDQRSLELGPFVRDSVALVRAHRAVRDCAVDIKVPPESPRLAASPTLLGEALTNLLVNAGEAMNGRGRIEVELTTTLAAIVLTVADAGPGVPVERRAELFSALKTTKAEGTGIGLFSTRACVRNLGGDITVGDSKLGGALFTITLPRA